MTRMSFSRRSTARLVTEMQNPNKHNLTIGLALTLNDFEFAVQQEELLKQTDLELYSMTLILKLNLDVPAYQNEVSMSRHSEIIARTDRKCDLPSHAGRKNYYYSL